MRAERGPSSADRTRPVDQPRSELQHADRSDIDIKCTTLEGIPEQTTWAPDWSVSSAPCGGSSEIPRSRRRHPAASGRNWTTRSTGNGDAPCRRRWIGQPGYAVTSRAEDPTDTRDQRPDRSLRPCFSGASSGLVPADAVPNPASTSHLASRWTRDRLCRSLRPPAASGSHPRRLPCVRNSVETCSRPSRCSCPGSRSMRIRTCVLHL